MRRIVIKPSTVFLGIFGDDPAWSPNGEPLELSLLVCRLEDVVVIDVEGDGGGDDADVLADGGIEAVEVGASEGVGRVAKISVDPDVLVETSNGEGLGSVEE